MTSNYAFHEHPERGCRRVAGLHGDRSGGRHVCLRLPVRRQQRERHVDQPADERQQRVDAVQRDSGRHQLHQCGLEHVRLRGHQRSSRWDQRAAGCVRQRCSDAVVDRLAAATDDRVVDVPVPESDHGNGPARRRRQERNDRGHLDAAVHAAVRERPESGASDALPDGLLADRGPDRPRAGARARDHPGLGQRDRRLAIGHRFRRNRQAA